MSFQKTFNIRHTRLNREVDIINTEQDPFNPMVIVIDFEYDPPVNYFIREQDIIYGVYIDRVFIRDFKEKKIKVQLENINVNHIVEVFAHPHEGFEFIRARLEPGNKIRIRFRARDPNIKDIERHDIYWDNTTGSFLAKRMGSVDPDTGEVSGAKLVEGSVT